MNPNINNILREKSFLDFSSHDVLAFVLKELGVRCNSNEAVTKLEEKFGCMKNIFSARQDQLLSVPEVTPYMAKVIGLIAPIASMYLQAQSSGEVLLSNREAAEKYCQSLFCGKQNEEFWVICLDSQCRRIGERKISEGDLTHCAIDTRKIISAALEMNAARIILCHNHPGGTCGASSADIKSTEIIVEAANLFSIQILDHIIVAGNSSYSMLLEGKLKMPA